MPFLKSIRNVFSKHRHQHAAEARPGSPNPALKPVVLPRINADHRFNLADQGWTSITYDTPIDPLQVSFQALLKACQKFFELPDAYKQQFKTEEGSEEGWSHVAGEKEFITIRTLHNTPEELKEAASKYWVEAGNFSNRLLGHVAESLDLPPESLTVYSEPCANLGEEKTATMLRLFRYEGFEGVNSKTVAEAHRDLGLLSLAMGDTPGLEVWDRHSNIWFPLERNYPAGTLMVGRQLENLTNGRYHSGGHRVRSHPDRSGKHAVVSSIAPKYRHSIVFVLRAHSPVSVDTDCLTTSITGKFYKPMKGITAGDLFKDIHSAHFNINTSFEEREEQRRKLAQAKKATHVL